MQDELSSGRGTFYTAVLQNMAYEPSGCPFSRPSRAPSAGGLPFKVLGALRWFCRAEGLGCHRPLAGARPRLFASRTRLAGIRPLVPACRVHRADVNGLRTCRAWLSAHVAGGPSSCDVYGQGAPQQLAHKGFRATGLPAVGRHRTELCESWT